MNIRPRSVADDELVITGVGAVSPIGFDLPVTHNSVRTDVCRFQEVAIPARGRQRLVGSPITGVFEDRIREDRLWRLACQAASEALERADTDVQQHLNRLRCGVFFLLPHHSRPGFSCGKDNQARAEFQRLLGLAEDSSCWLEMLSGPSSAVEALRLAHAALTDGSFDVCLIGGADSLLQIRVLRWIEDADRLKTETNSDGLIPGEAAAFLVVEQSGAASRRNARALARICGHGLASEESNAHSGTPCRAVALTECLRDALTASGLAADQIDNVWCDLNGESYRSREWALASMRLGFSDSVTLTHPADCVGDIGAVSGSLLLALSAWEISQANRKRNDLVFVASDHGVRAAVVLCHVVPSVGITANHYPARAQNIRCDVIEEHLEELQSLWCLRRAILRSAEYGTTDLQKLDRRIEAHLRGLYLGSETTTAIARDALTKSDPLEVFVAAFTLLRFGNSTDQQAVVDSVLQSPPGQFSSAIDALCQAASTELLRSWIDQALKSGAPWEFVVGAEVAAFRRIAQPRADVLHELLIHESPDIRMRAWRAAGLSRQGFYRASFERGLSDDDSRVREEAAMCAVCTRQHWFVAWCREKSSHREDALQWLGVLGEEEDSRLLIRCSNQPDLAPSAILALASLGFPSVIDYILELMNSTDSRMAIAAGLAFRMITGKTVDSESRVEVSLSRTDDADESFRREFLDEYFLPDPAQAREHWKTVRNAFPDGSRWRSGLAVSEPIADRVWHRLDLEGRWEAGLRGSYFGWWKGNLTDFLIFPQI